MKRSQPNSGKTSRTPTDIRRKKALLPLKHRAPRTLSPDLQPPPPPPYFSLEVEEKFPRKRSHQVQGKWGKKVVAAMVQAHNRRPMTSQKSGGGAIAGGVYLASEESDKRRLVVEQSDFENLKTFRPLMEERMMMLEREGAPFSAPRMAAEQPDQFMQHSQQPPSYFTRVPGFLIQEHPNPAYFVGQQQPHLVPAEHQPKRGRGSSCPTASSSSHRRPMVVKTNKMPDVFTLPVANMAPASAAAGLFQGGGFQMAPAFQPQCFQIYNMQNNVHFGSEPFMIRQQAQPTNDYFMASSIPHIMRPSQSDSTLESYRPFSNHSERVSREIIPPRRKVKLAYGAATPATDYIDESGVDLKGKNVKKKSDKFMGAILMHQNKAHLMKSSHHYFSKKKKSLPTTVDLVGKVHPASKKTKHVIDLSQSETFSQKAGVRDPRNVMRSYLENSKRLTPRGAGGGQWGVDLLSSKEVSSLASRPSHSVKLSEITSNGSLEGRASDYFKERRASEPAQGAGEEEFYFGGEEEEKKVKRRKYERRAMDLISEEGEEENQ